MSKVIGKQNKMAEEGKAKHKTGVVYLSKVPRRMHPGDVKPYFERFGFAVGRVFFSPESAADREARMKKKRKKDKAKPGKRDKQRYTEGWIEFLRKRDAKNVASTFTGRMVEGNASYAQEIWGLRYLRGFKFDQLMQEEIYRKAMHARQVEAALKDARESTNLYLERVAQAKRIAYTKEMKRLHGEEFKEFQAPLVKQRVLMDDSASTAVSGSLQQAIMPPGVDSMTLEKQGGDKGKKKRGAAEKGGNNHQGKHQSEQEQKSKPKPKQKKAKTLSKHQFSF